jgi:hypothetical protein
MFKILRAGVVIAVGADFRGREWEVGSLFDRQTQGW